MLGCKSRWRRCYFFTQRMFGALCLRWYSCLWSCCVLGFEEPAVSIFRAYSPLWIEVANCSKHLALVYQTTRRRILEDSSPHSHQRENLKSHIIDLVCLLLQTFKSWKKLWNQVFEHVPCAYTRTWSSYIVISASLSVVTCGGPAVPFQKEDNDDAVGISIFVCHEFRDHLRWHLTL